MLKVTTVCLYFVKFNVKRDKIFSLYNGCLVLPGQRWQEQGPQAQAVLEILTFLKFEFE